MLKVLITGGAGFIGYALAKKLQDKHDITLLDLEHRWQEYHKSFKLYSANISNEIELNNLDKDFDIVFHLAAQSSGYISLIRPEEDVDSNAKGTLNICNFCRKTGVKKIVFTSSMAVYGEGDALKETDIPRPISNYGVTKLAGENYIKVFSQYGLKYTIFRLFNSYGPGQDLTNLRQGMVSIYLAQTLSGKEIKVTGSFDRYRDFIFIDDVLSALTLSLNDITDNETYNIGTGNPTRVHDLINIILDTHDLPKEQFQIINVGSHDGDQKGNYADPTKLKSIGWEPKTSLEKGVQIFYREVKK
jgi:UDP-glucose 4-epimerase